MEYDIVPVVLGLGNYQKILPPKSYLDIMDFKSPRHLANYMLELANDEEKYSKYLEWKYNYRVMMNLELFNKTFCELCKALHQEPIHSKVCEDMAQWHGLNECNPNQMEELLKRGNW